MAPATRLFCYVILGSALLAGTAQSRTRVGAAPPPTPAEAKPAQDPTSRALLPLMTGEFALQAGRLPEAVASYLAAAEAAGDPALAEQATRIASWHGTKHAQRRPSRCGAGWAGRALH